jgi:hypothetical protein
MLGGIAVLLILLIPTVSRAELMDYFDSAMSPWYGSTHLAEPFKPDVTIYYAVYTRDAFNLTFGDMDPNNHDSRVYTYQLVNAAVSPVITKFTVGLDSRASPAGITEINDPDGGSGTASLLPAFAPLSPPYGSAVWNYTPSLAAGGKSKILLFTSSQDPQWLSATVKGNVQAESGLVPSPIPEPTSLISLIMAVIFFVLLRPIRFIFF